MRSYTGKNRYCCSHACVAVVLKLFDAFSGVRGKKKASYTVDMLFTTWSSDISNCRLGHFRLQVGGEQETLATPQIHAYFQGFGTFYYSGWKIEEYIVEAISLCGCVFVCLLYHGRKTGNRSLIYQLFRTIRR